jgi:TonB family protein
MPKAGESLQGRVVGGKFRLIRYLGGSDRSAVFLTERHQGGPKTAAIKLMPADPASVDIQLSRWKLISKLSHPHLLQLFEMGRCQQDGADLVYVVMEYAEENLAQVLPSRALTSDEARAMLKPTLEALAYLHGCGLVHGHLKPANIMVVGNQLKLSSDGICRIGQLDGVGTGSYGPPELPGTEAAPARDVWSLGVTLVQVLTQLLPVWDGKEQEALTLPETLPPQFLDLARTCLERDSKRRCTLPEIAAHLQFTLPAPRTEPIVAQQQAPERPRRPVRTVRSFVPAFAVILTFVLLVWGVRLFNRQTSQPAPSAAALEQPIPQQPSQQLPSPQLPSAVAERPTTAPPKAQPPARATLKTASEVRNVAPPPSPAPRATAVAGNLVPGQVVQQVLPDVSRDAARTIRGTVRVAVSVRVDLAGNVSGVNLVSAGPSPYFARLASDAARRWKFSPPRSGGQSVPSAWTLRFEFTQGGTRVVPAAVL